MKNMDSVKRNPRAANSVNPYQPTI